MTTAPNIVEVEAYCEGSTEVGIVKPLFSSQKKTGKLCPYRIEPINLQGKKGPHDPEKDPLYAGLSATIKRLQSNPEIAKKILILLDKDNESVEQTRQELLETLRKIDATSEFHELENVQGAFRLSHTQLGNVELVLHLACYHHPSVEDKPTSDDCLLKLALKPKTAENLFKSCNKSSSWSGMSHEKLIDKIATELPSLLRKNGINSVSAKQLLIFYSAIIAPDTSLPGFAEKIVHHSDAEDIKETFPSLIAAFKHLGLTYES
jgi:hypothetical protein